MVTEAQIKEIIKETMGASYIGKLNIFQDDGYYLLQLYFQQEERPRITIGKETDDDNDFLDYVREELQARKMNIVKFWRLDKLDEPVNG